MASQKRKNAKLVQSTIFSIFEKKKKRERAHEQQHKNVRGGDPEKELLTDIISSGIVSLSTNLSSDYTCNSNSDCKVIGGSQGVKNCKKNKSPAFLSVSEKPSEHSDGFPETSKNQFNISNEMLNTKFGDTKFAHSENAFHQNTQSTLDRIFSRLSAEEKNILTEEIVSLPVEWLFMLLEEIRRPYFRQLKQFIRVESTTQTICPPLDLVYSWAQMCSPRAVKLVILGQDPNHNDNQAMGLAFSIIRDCPEVKFPPTLRNIYNELENDISGFKAPSHGDLSGWARQGVLLLNTVLTVRAHQPASHAGKGWERFTDTVISVVNRANSNVVFMLWGSHAQKKISMIDSTRHCVLTSMHPSPQSASRGFLGCGHFSKANNFLISKGIDPIDWAAL